MSAKSPLNKLCKERKYKNTELQEQLEVARRVACSMLYDGYSTHEKGEKAVLNYHIRCEAYAQAYYPTRIGESKQKGRKTMVHYSIDDIYVGGTTKLGDKPLTVLQWIKVSKKNVKKGYWKVDCDTKQLYPNPDMNTNPVKEEVSKLCVI